jgi:O-antigen ligase
MINLNVIKFKKIDVPIVVWIVVIFTFVASAGVFSIFGRKMAGWAWVVPFVISAFFILRHLGRISFPIRIWLPWICFVTGYFAASGFIYLQRNMMLLSPLVIGMAVSSGRIREVQLKGFLSLAGFLVFLLFFTISIKTGMLFTGVLPMWGGFAPQSMTAALLCCIFAVGYSLKGKEDLIRWIVGATIPVIALTRMGMVAAGLTIPLTFSSLGIKKRLAFLAVISIVGLSLFYTERVQRQMFYSGLGRLEDIRFSNPDFFTAGRSHLWDLMIEEIKMKPVWGHGANASEEFVLAATWGTLTHPHNDWLRLLYDYGFVGASVFAFCLVAQVIHLLKRAKNTFGESKILLYAGASSFLPFVLLMFTDNIILYAAFFGNLQFTILGLVYAAEKTREIDALNYYRQLAAAAPVSAERMNYRESGFGGVGRRDWISVQGKRS